MPKIIVKCPYSKAGGRREVEHRENAVGYIATRDGVDKMSDTAKQLPATNSQQKFIAGLLKDFPEAEKLFEYEDFLQKPTRENASEFITQTIEQNLFEIAKRENYVDYIANRPHVEKIGEHGLFTKDSVQIVLSQVADEVANHPGNVWMPIISLRREDAARLGYDSGKQWMELLRAYEPKLAKQMKIPLENFHWYAAFHNESHHPHVHMICYSDNPKHGWWTKEGAENIKSELARTIFRQELVSIYEEQTQYRNLLTSESKTAMHELCRKASSGICDNEIIMALLPALGERLKNSSGKKVYGYLQPDVKQMVDAIVDELAKDENLSKLYDAWYEKRFDVLRTYTDTMPPKEPLSKLTEFKAIKNMVIKEAMQLASGGFSFEDKRMTEPEIVEDAQPPEYDPALPDVENVEFEDADELLPSASDEPPHDGGEVYVAWTAQYKQAKIYLFGDEDTPPDFEKAFTILLAEAENGNALAMHDLGRMFADGLGRDGDIDAAYDWYKKALTAFHAVEDVEPKPYTEYRIGKMYNAGLGTEQDYTKAAEWFTPAAAEGRSKNGKGNKYAQYSLGGLYYKGNGVTQSYETALQLYSKSAGQDFPYASYELAKMYRDGIGIIKNESEAGEHFKKAFTGFVALEKQSHDDKLQYRIGQMLLTGTGTEKDLVRATEYFEKSARLGNTYAQYQLAKIYLADEADDPVKIQTAIDWLTKSAEGENQFAQYALGKLYRDGTHVEKNEIEALRLFTLSAEQDNEYAAYALGKLYLKSDVIAKDATAAVKWLSKSADLGNQFAQYALGKLYLLGEDVQKDIVKAICFLEKSAVQKNEFGGRVAIEAPVEPQSQQVFLQSKTRTTVSELAAYQLGKIYLTGEDVSKDMETALRWLGESAAQGNQFAQYALGKLYIMGKEVPRDREKALEYFTLAAAQGNEYAQFFIEHMDSFRDPSVALAATNLLRHLSRIFEDTAIPDLNRKAMQIDRKRRQKLAEKKQAQGHARDDHEQEFIM